MDSRKTAKSDLESKRTIFIEIGLVIALALVLLGFQYKNYERVKFNLGARNNVSQVEEVVIQTQQETKIEPPRPQPQTTILNIVENNVDITNDLVIDAEVNQNTQIQEYVPPANLGKSEEQEIVEQEIFTVVEEAPSFPGGEESRIKWLQDHIKYPQMARESGIQGTVYVTFVVEPNGSVSHVKILRGIGGGCDEEAVRVVQAMPSWNPGKQRGKPVRVQFNMPIKFTLQG
jgi:protein TonB